MIKPEGKNSVFLVKFDQLAEIKFRSCVGMNFEVEPIFFAEAGQGKGNRSARGRVMGSQISFGYGTVEDRQRGKSDGSISNWLMSVMDLDVKLDKRDGRITLQDDGGGIIAKWKIQKAWPCRWEGPQLGASLESGNGLTIDTVTFTHEGIQRTD